MGQHMVSFDADENGDRGTVISVSRAIRTMSPSSPLGMQVPGPGNFRRNDAPNKADPQHPLLRGGQKGGRGSERPCVAPRRGRHYPRGRRFGTVCRGVDLCLKPVNSSVMKADIKSYYTSIDHDVPYELAGEYIPDHFVLRLIRQYLSRTVCLGENYRDITRGISLGCPLSPLMGALYLKPMDDAVGGDRSF